MSAVKIVIVDDHPLFRGALSQALSASFTDADIGEAGSLDELTQRLETDKDVDLVLLDLSMPGVQGLSGLLFLGRSTPRSTVVVVSADEDPRQFAVASSSAPQASCPSRSRLKISAMPCAPSSEARSGRPRISISPPAPIVRPMTCSPASRH